MTSEESTVSITTTVPESEVLGTYGEYVGNCKWFNHKIGYGFVTIINGDQKGKDIFVHHTGVQPKNSNFRTLSKGEYVSLNLTQGQNGLQGIDITGVFGGPLMCDSNVMPARQFRQGEFTQRDNSVGRDNRVSSNTPMTD
jgi:cold shock CspA family protein